MYKDVKKVIAAGLGANHHDHADETAEMLEQEDTAVLEATQAALAQLLRQVDYEMSFRKARAAGFVGGQG